MFLEFFYIFVNIFCKIKYVIIYYILGGKAILHDIFYRQYNRVELRSKSKHVAIVTGGARGIGSSIVKMLMECDMHVVIGCINTENAKMMIKKLREQGVVKGEASVLELNLKSLKSVSKFASLFNECHEYLNILVNNAGIMFMPYEETEDGFESQFAVNYLGHFLLTHLLLPRMFEASRRFTTSPRIVNVSSCAHEVSPIINFDDINMTNFYIEQAAYAQSKICLLMFSKALDRRLKRAGSNIQVITVHPGIVNTELFNGTLVKLLAPWVLTIFGKTPEEGATSVVFCCIDDSTENAGGSYYSNCFPVKCTQYADDVKTQEKLYNFSNELIKKYCSNDI